MTNLIKTISITLLITLSMAFISCKDKGSTDPTMKYSDLVGTWNGSGSSFSINDSGYVNFTYNGTTYDNQILDDMDFEFIEGAVTSYNSGYQDYVNPNNDDTRKIASFYFNSSSSCDVTIKEDRYSGTYPDGSWVTENTIQVGNFTK